MMRKFVILGVLAVVSVGCGSNSADGGDPSKAPRVEEVKPQKGWTRPEDGLAAKHAAGQAKRKAESEGDTGGGN
jgi:hypothetical protein